jgi:ABC-2 type transport system permease protein
MTFGVPIIAAIVVVVYIAVQDDEPAPNNPLADLPDKPIGYVDRSGLFSDPGELGSILVPYSDEASARVALEQGKVKSYYIIAADYMRTGHVTRKAPQLDFTESDSGFFRAFLILQLLGNESPELLLRLHQSARVIEHQLDANGIELSQTDEEERYGSSFILVYGFGMILLLSTLIPSGYLLRSVVEEKENRTIEVILSSLSPVQLLTGKVVGQGAMALLQILVWLAASWLLLNLASAELAGLSDVDLTLQQLVLLVLYFVGGFLLVACFQAGLGAVSTNMREGPQYAAFFTLPMVAPLWLLNVFIETPNASLAVALSLVPITAPLAMVQRIAITVVPWWQLVISLFLLALGIVFTLWLTSKIFRVNTLLAGTMPNLVDLIKLFREA